MTLPAGIYSYLHDQNIVGTRIYPSPLPEKPTLPAITYSLISTDRMLTNSGPVDLIDARVQFDCWGKTHDSAVEVAERLVESVHGFFDDTWGSVEVALAYADNELHLFDSPSGLHRRVVDVIIKHRDPAFIGS